MNKKLALLGLCSALSLSESGAMQSSQVTEERSNQNICAMIQRIDENVIALLRNATTRTNQEQELSETRTAMLRAQNDVARLKEQLDIAIEKVSSLEEQLAQANQEIHDLKKKNNHDLIERLEHCSTPHDIVDVFFAFGICSDSILIDALHRSNHLMHLHHLDEMIQLDMIPCDLRYEIERLRQAQCERDDLRNELEALKSSMNK